MDFSYLRNQMLEIATLEMTKKPEVWDVLKETIVTGLFALRDVNDNCICYDQNWEVEDIYIYDKDLDEAGLEQAISIIENTPWTVSIYFEYEFGEGHYHKKTPTNYIPAWNSAFDNYDYDAWEKRVCLRLQDLNPEYPYVWVNSDTELGYQGFTLYISQGPRPDYD